MAQNELSNTERYCELAAEGITELLLSFFTWIDAEADSKDLFFLSREGSFLHSLYQLANARSNAKHICVSRRVVSAALSTDLASIEYVLSQPHSECDLADLLKERFYLDDEYLGAYRHYSSKELSSEKFIRATALSLLEVITDEAITARSTLCRYLTEVGVSKNSVVIDIGYRGFMQFGISKVLNINLPGRYLLVSENKIRGQEMRGYVERGKGRRVLHRIRLDLERIMTADQDSVDRITEYNGAIRFSYKRREPQLNELSAIKLLIKEQIRCGRGRRTWYGDYWKKIDLGLSGIGKKLFIEDCFGGMQVRPTTVDRE